MGPFAAAHVPKTLPKLRAVSTAAPKRYRDAPRTAEAEEVETITCNAENHQIQMACRTLLGHSTFQSIIARTIRNSLFELMLRNASLFGTAVASTIRSFTLIERASSPLSMVSNSAFPLTVPAEFSETERIRGLTPPGSSDVPEQ